MSIHQMPVAFQLVATGLLMPLTLKGQADVTVFWFPDQEMYIFLGHCLLFVILRKAVFLMLEKI